MHKTYEPEVLRGLQEAELNILKDFDKVCTAYGIHYFLTAGTLLGAVRHHGFIPWDDDLDVGMTRADFDKFVQVMPKELGKGYLLATPKSHPGYCGAVVKLMRKGTKFVPAFSMEMGCWLGIHMDIFVWDNLCGTRVGAWLQIKEARILSMLIFLCGSSRPSIGSHGAIKLILQRVCGLAHWGLCRIPNGAEKLYRCFEKVSKRENGKKTNYMACFQGVDIYKNVCKRKSLGPDCYVRKEFEGFAASVQKNHKESLRKMYGKDYMELPPVQDRVNHCAEVIDFGNV